MEDVAVLANGRKLFSCGSLNGALENVRRIRREGGYKNTILFVRYGGWTINADSFIKSLDKLNEGR